MITYSAGVAQLVEHLTCNQGVASSIPAAGTKLKKQPENGCFFAFKYLEYCIMRPFQNL